MHSKIVKLVICGTVFSLNVDFSSALVMLFLLAGVEGNFGLLVQIKESHGCHERGNTQR